MPRPNIFIDVGPPKTASTFRQLVLYPKMDVLVYNHCFKKGDVEFINFESDKKIILSDETLYGWMYLPKHNAVLERKNCLKNLKRFFPEAGIIICRRELESWKQSLYKQYIWAGGSNDYRRWLNRLDDAVFDIEEYIYKLHENFEYVLILDFNDLKKDYRKYCRDICNFVGVSLPNFENRILNLGLSDQQTFILRLINKLLWTHEGTGIPGFRPWRDMLYRLTKKLGQ